MTDPVPCLFPGCRGTVAFDDPTDEVPMLGQVHRSRCRYGHVHERSDATGEVWLVSGSPEQ